MEAVTRNDAEEIRRLRAAGVEVNMGSETGPYPMEAALDLGDLDGFLALAEEVEAEQLEFVLCPAASAGQAGVVDRPLAENVATKKAIRMAASLWEGEMLDLLRDPSF